MEKMNRLLFCTILTLMFFNSGYSQLLKRDIEDYNIKGSVKSLKEITYDAIDQLGTIVKGKLSTKDFVGCAKNYKHNYFVLFDIKGNKLQYDEYSNPIRPWCTTKYIYTNKRLEMEIEKMYLSDGNIDVKILYKYDKEGNKIEECAYRTGNRHDDEGNKIEESADKNGTFFIRMFLKI